MLLYTGPGIALGTFVLVFVVMAIVALSIGVVLWNSIKRWFKK